LDFSLSKFDFRLKQVYMLITLTDIWKGVLTNNSIAQAPSSLIQ